MIQQPIDPFPPSELHNPFKFPAWVFHRGDLGPGRKTKVHLLKNKHHIKGSIHPQCQHLASCSIPRAFPDFHSCGWMSPLQISRLVTKDKQDHSPTPDLQHLSQPCSACFSSQPGINSLSGQSEHRIKIYSWVMSSSPMSSFY